MHLSDHKNLQMRAALATVLWLALFGGIAKARAQDPQANDSQSDGEEVFSLSGFGDESNATDADG